MRVRERDGWQEMSDVVRRSKFLPPLSSLQQSRATEKKRENTIERKSRTPLRKGW